MPRQPKPIILVGRSLSTGLAQGTTFVHHDILDRVDEFYDIEGDQAQEEHQRLDKAITTITADLEDLAARVGKEIDAQLAGIFEAHCLMLRDPSLKKELHQEITDQLVSAGSAVKTVFRRWERRFLSMQAEVARQKGEDMKDLARRLLASLGGIHGHALEHLPPQTVLVAKQMLPSDTVFLARRSATAALLEFAGPGSHAALFAREIGLPCVSHLSDVTRIVAHRQPVLVDADQGKVILHPSSAQKESLQRRLARRNTVYSQARKRAQDSAVTRDGMHITVLANVGCREDTEYAMENGAEGVGLYRIEQAYFAHQSPPNTKQLIAELKRTLTPAAGRPVHIRLLDVGADKPLPFLDIHREINPSLGRRGIRLLRDYPDLLRTQLEALLKLSAEFDLRIIVPMVTLPEDLDEPRETLSQVAASVSCHPIPPLGAMIETPAAALSGKALAPAANFFSIGTNDLTQYTFAVDRENAAVDRYFNDNHEILFRLLGILHRDVPSMPLSVCGELAGRPESVPRLLQCGVRTLSVAPPLIPMVKDTIRQCIGKSS